MGLAEEPFQTVHVNRIQHTYREYPQSNNYIKENKVIKVRGKEQFLHIITMNITALHDVTRAWLVEQTADIILVQEHRMVTLGQFGKIPGCDIMFSPARRTICSDRGWETLGGVAILYRTKMFHLINDKGIKTKGHSWITMRIHVEKQQELIVVNTYTKRGWELEVLSTLEQVQEYISMYDAPWIYGGVISTAHPRNC